MANKQKPTRKQRIDLLAIFLGVLLSSFVFGCLLGTVEPYVGDGTAATALKTGLYMMLGATMVINGTVLLAQYLSRRSTAFRTVAAVLWPLTLLAGGLVGAVCAIPYQIYNIIRILAKKDAAAIAEIPETKTQA